MDSLNVTGYGSLSRAYATTPASSTQSTSGDDSASTSKAKKKSSLDMTDFLKLMAAQFQSQNLDSNVDNTQYIAELAQFSAIQAMTSMTQNFSRQYAASMIGKTVTVNTDDINHPTLTGIVQGAVYDSEGNSKIVIGDNSYDVSDITQTSEDNTETILALREYASSLIGYTVTVSTGDKDNPTVTGVVQSAAYGTDGSCAIVIDGKSYNPADVTAVEVGTTKT